MFRLFDAKFRTAPRAVNIREAKSKPLAGRRVALGTEVKFSAPRALEDMDASRHADPGKCIVKRMDAWHLLHCGGARLLGDWSDIERLGYWREHVVFLGLRTPEMPTRW
jgi:hypothetical protein